jgi:hypothetical protein
MRYRRFGKTNLNLSVFSLGIMRCSHSESNLLATLKQAISLGINHIETAREYGRSEEKFGKVISQLPVKREDLIITTKLYPTANAKKMKTWLNQSIDRLQVDYIDCVAIHGINTFQHISEIQEVSGCMEVLKEAKAQGKVKNIGFSTHGSLEVILAAINTDFFDFINLHYYYFFQRNALAIKLAAQKDLGIFIISPADKGGRLYTPPEKLKQICHPLSPLHFNYRFLLANPSITTLSVGAANPKELFNPLKVADQDYSLTEEEQGILRKLELELEQNLGSERCKQCYQCLPCPENINIPEILRLRNLAVGLDMTEYGQYRYQMLENAGHWVPGNKGEKCTTCGDCLPRCPEKLNIPELLLDSHKRLNGESRRRLWE